MRDPPRFFLGGSPLLEVLPLFEDVELPPVLSLVVLLLVVDEDESFSFSAALFRDRLEVVLFVAAGALTAAAAGVDEDVLLDVPEGVPARLAADPEGVGVAVPPLTFSLVSSPPPAPPDEELALVLLLTVDDWPAVEPPPPPLLLSLVVSSLDGVEARESLSLSLSPLVFLPDDFLFLLEFACSFETSFCRWTFASLYLSTRFSGTHSSQLERIFRD